MLATASDWVRHHEMDVCGVVVPEERICRGSGELISYASVTESTTEWVRDHEREVVRNFPWEWSGCGVDDRRRGVRGGG